MQAKSTTISKKIDLSSVPEEYHEYTDVFSKSKTETLTPYCPYDLWIELENDSHPLVGTIYSLSKFEQEALKEFIDENLMNRFICSTSSPHEVPVLFIKKKDGSLWLCVDFHGLNKITKKDQYSFPLISDLLDPLAKLVFTPRLTSSMCTTWSALPKETNGKLPSKLAMEPLNGQ